MRTVLMSLACAAVVAGSTGAAAQAAPPLEQQRALWQHVCEDAAGGVVSPQEALVCVHSGSVWGDAEQNVLQRVCEGALGGTYVRRSEFPVELAACFFD
jgi:hypothetical protein